MKEYDLNVFYEDLGHDENGVNQWSDVYTIQPSVYRVEDGKVDRQYMESFKLTLLETRALEPDFPDEEYGSDFFITLDEFVHRAKAMPDRVASILSLLPPVDEVPWGGPETKWLDMLF